MIEARTRRADDRKEVVITMNVEGEDISAAVDLGDDLAQRTGRVDQVLRYNGRAGRGRNLRSDSVAVRDISISDDSPISLSKPDKAIVDVPDISGLVALSSQVSV